MDVSHLRVCPFAFVGGSRMDRSCQPCRTRHGALNVSSRMSKSQLLLATRQVPVLHKELAFPSQVSPWVALRFPLKVLLLLSTSFPWPVPAIFCPYRVS